MNVLQIAHFFGVTVKPGEVEKTGSHSLRQSRWLVFLLVSVGPVGILYQQEDRIMALSDMKCRNARPGDKLLKLSDGEGLQFWVQPTGGRLWRLAYRFAGKQKLLALGTYPVISLADARAARDAARKLLAAGIDPSEDKKQRKVLQYGSGDSFRAIAEEYVAKLKREGRTEATISKIEWLLSFAYPTLGTRSIKEIDASAVLRVLREVEVRGRYESARRLRSTIGSVFRYAVASAE